MIIDLSKYPQTIQPSYRPLLFNKSRFLVFIGGAGAGKSHFAHQKMVYRCLSEPNSSHFIIRKTNRSHRNTTFPVICKIINDLGFGDFIRVNKSDMTIQFLHPFNSIIYFSGCDDPEKLKSLTNPSSIFIEEASELTMNDFDQICLRLRGLECKYNQIIISANPCGGTQSWLYKTFFIKKHPQSSVFHCTIFNNIYADKEYLKYILYRSKQDETFKKIYLEGNWTNSEGQIFTNWTTISQNQFPKKFDWKAYGVDWGYKDPTTIIEVICHDKDLYITERLYQTELTTDEIIRIIKSEIKPNNKYEDIICDSAEPDKIKAFQNAGLNAYGVKKGPGSIVRGIDILKSRKLYIHEDSTNIINELNTYTWKKDANNVFMDVPINNFDHTIDAIRYVAMHKLNNEVDPTLPILATGLNVRPK